MAGLFFALLAAGIGQAPTTQPKREAVYEFATCVDRRAPDRVEALLASQPSSDQEKRAARLIAGAYNSCISGRPVLSFQIGMLRGLLADRRFAANEALRDRAATLAASPAVAPDVIALEKIVARSPEASHDVAFVEGFRPLYAGCVARADPRAVAALSTTQPASAAERGATLAIGDALMRCMPAGVSYRIIPSELRPYLISALYYTAVAVPAGG